MAISVEDHFVITRVVRDTNGQTEYLRQLAIGGPWEITTEYRLATKYGTLNAALTVINNTAMPLQGDFMIDRILRRINQ
jgi:hypothetical protein